MPACRSSPPTSRAISPASPRPATRKDAFVKRAKEIGIEYVPDRFPVVFWDLFGEQGHRVRATISEMGPLLLSRLLDLNDTQEGVLNIAFRIADEQGLLLLDLKDLRALLQLIAENAPGAHDDIRQRLEGHRSARSSASSSCSRTRRASEFFGEPALDIKDLMRTDRDGRGIVNILAADKLMNNPRLYATFLLWLMSELFEELPEVGDLDKPKLVFFFDEAHLLFNDAPKALLEAVEQVVRLIRSKGVGVYFVTQNPVDIPESVLAQLGNRVQHALRAFTPRDQKAVRVAAETFRQNPAFNTEKAITELGVGEALVSTLEGKGTPSMVERTLIAPPMAQVGPIDAAERQRLIAASPLRGKYDTTIDQESAYEMLTKRAARDGRRGAGGGRAAAASSTCSAGCSALARARKGSMTRQPARHARRSRAPSSTRRSARSPPSSAAPSAAVKAPRSAAPSCAARLGGLLRR